MNFPLQVLQYTGCDLFPNSPLCSFDGLDDQWERMLARIAV